MGVDEACLLQCMGQEAVIVNPEVLFATRNREECLLALLTSQAAEGQEVQLDVKRLKRRSTRICSLSVWSAAKFCVTSLIIG